MAAEETREMALRHESEVESDSRERNGALPQHRKVHSYAAAVGEVAKAHARRVLKLSREVPCRETDGAGNALRPQRNRQVYVDVFDQPSHNRGAENTRGSPPSRRSRAGRHADPLNEMASRDLVADLLRKLTC